MFYDLKQDYIPTYEEIYIHIAAFNIRVRHNILYHSIGFKSEEGYSMEMVTWLVVGSTAYVLFGTLFESIFFNLYNSSFHPFANILDISETSRKHKQLSSRDWLKKLHWPKNIPLIKNPQFYSDLAEVLAILHKHGLINLTMFDEDQTKTVDFLLVVYFWSSVTF